jgi:hypothetical protein
VRHHPTGSVQHAGGLGVELCQQMRSGNALTADVTGKPLRWLQLQLPGRVCSSRIQDVKFAFRGRILDNSTCRLHTALRALARHIPMPQVSAANLLLS